MISFEEFKPKRPPVVFEQQNPFSMLPLIVGPKNFVYKSRSCISDKAAIEIIKWINKHEKFQIPDVSKGAGYAESMCWKFTKQLKDRGYLSSRRGKFVLGEGAAKNDYTRLKMIPLSVIDEIRG